MVSWILTLHTVWIMMQYQLATKVTRNLAEIEWNCVRLWHVRALLGNWSFYHPFWMVWTWTLWRLWTLFKAVLTYQTLSLKYIFLILLYLIFEIHFLIYQMLDIQDSALNKIVTVFIFLFFQSSFFATATNVPQYFV